MKVLHVIEPFASGITTFLIHLTRHLPQHHHIILHGTRTSVDTINKVKNRFSEGVEFVEWKNAQREISIVNDIKAFLFLLNFIKNRNPGFIHLHSSKAGFLGRITCFFLGKKNSIYTPHSAPFLRTDISSFTQWLYISLEKLANKLNSHVICCCEAEQMAYQKIGLNAKVINNGTPDVVIEKTYSPTITIIFSGLLTKQKNPTLFNQIAMSLKSEKGIEIVWIGDGELRPELTSSNIKITGWIERSDIDKYYQKASIYLSTSDWEGLPYGVLEAMTASCCLVLTKSGGHIDLVQSQNNGFLFNEAAEATSHIKYLLKNPDKMRLMGNASKEIVKEKFEVQQMADSYNELYHSYSPL